MEFPYKRIAEFADDASAEKDLLEKLKAKIKKRRLQVLAKQISGQKNLPAIYGAAGEHKCRINYGEYHYDDAVIPFVVEGFLLNNKDDSDPFKTLTASGRTRSLMKRSPFISTSIER